MTPGPYNIQHPTTKGGTPTVAAPWIYFVVEKVNFSHTHRLFTAPRPNQEARLRKRAFRERKLTLLCMAIETSGGSTGVRTSAADPSGTGKNIVEELETAWASWKDSGSIRLQVGTKDDGMAKTYDGLIENITFEWSPAGADDEVKSAGFVLNFIVASAVS